MEHVIHEIFPVQIYEVKLELDTEKIQSYCKEYQSTHDSANKSNVGGYQSQDLQLNNPILQPLITKLEHHSSNFRGNTQVISNMWFNINQYKDSNASHIHPFSVYSGVYYITTPENCGLIQFEHPAQDLLLYWGTIASGASHASSICKYSAIKNTLYIFPSWLKHSVLPNKNQEEKRISISFNTSNGV
tara:strand:+ start:289 stop:852 length:564 start_codon:yes stop_codon:yes gene_type:complete